MDLDFLFAWMKRRLRAFVGIGPRQVAAGEATPDRARGGSAPDAEVPRGDGSTSPHVDEAPKGPRERAASKARSELGREIDAAWFKLDQHATHEEISSYYDVWVARLAYDGYVRDCPDLVTDVLAWWLARLAVNADKPGAMPEAIRALSQYMLEHQAQKRAGEDVKRAKDAGCTLH